jgi:hypothetical protein
VAAVVADLREGFGYVAKTKWLLSSLLFALAVLAERRETWKAVW